MFESLRNEIAALTAIETDVRTQAEVISSAIKGALGLLGATWNRKAIAPVLEQGSDGDGERSEWKGIKFHGGRKRFFKGGGSNYSSYQWGLAGSTDYLTQDGRVYEIDWSGEESDFGGCDGYAARIQSEVKGSTLEDYLTEYPQMAEDIISAIVKLVESDTKAAKGRLESVKEQIAKALAA